MIERLCVRTPKPDGKWIIVVFLFEKTKNDFIRTEMEHIRIQGIGVLLINFIALRIRFLKKPRRSA